MTVTSSESLTQTLPPLLASRVARHWQDWQTACEAIQRDPLPPADTADMPLLGKIWACSEFVADTMIRHPELWFELLEQGTLKRSYSLQSYQQELQQRFAEMGEPLNDAQLMRQLRLFRHQQMLRIAWRDLAGLADNVETFRNVTDLAEACVDSTLELLYADQCRQLGEPCDSEGKPQRMVVLGMGKLGGYELNYSSDIDLIFYYPEEGETTGSRPMAASQFFIRLGQRLIKVLDEITGDGFVFRVDMRLRPYGDSGPLVMSHAGLEAYYQTQGRNGDR